MDLAIENMASGGSGVGRVDNFVVFVRSTMPGDRVRARVVRKKKGHAEARLEEIVTPSPDRLAPPCPHFGHCGGCQWQHVPYSLQLGFKETLVREAMERIGGLSDPPVKAPLPSPQKFGYRNKMEFSFSDRRWFPPEELHRRDVEGGFALGLHVPGTFSKVMEIDGCLLQPETGNQILREVKTFARASGAPPYGLKSHQGFWRFLMLRYAPAYDQWMVNLVTAEERVEVLAPLAERLREKFETVKTVVNNVTARKAAVAAGEQERVLSGDGTLWDRIGPHRFQISANSFFQTNSRGAEKLYQTVSELLELRGDEQVLDLYSGTGTIPIFLAGRVRRVTGIELSRSAVLDAQRNCRENNIHNCGFMWGDIREQLSRVRSRPDAVVIDPPRAGMHKDVVGQVMSLSPKRLIYVSCNPATLARDLAHLARDYEVLQIQPVDLFPHTHHIESVARLHRKTKP